MVRSYVFQVTCVFSVDVFCCWDVFCWAQIFRVIGWLGYRGRIAPGIASIIDLVVTHVQVLKCLNTRVPAVNGRTCSKMQSVCITQTHQNHCKVHL